MKILYPLGVLFFALLLAACAEADFKPYVGQQQDWPTAPGAIVDTRHVVPVYYGALPRPYRVLGYLEATTAPVRRRDTINFSARRAKEMGGDAIIVLSEGSQYVGTYSSGSATGYGTYTGQQIGNTVYGSGTTYASGSSMSFPMFGGRASVIVIKFR
jgi:hypothetical protein